MINRKWVIGFIVVFLVSIVVLIVTMVIPPNQTRKQKQTGSDTSFTIVGLDSEELAINSEDQGSIIKTIKYRIMTTKKDTTNVSGLVRKNSYKKQATDSGILSTFIVDVGSVRQSYLVSMGDGTDGYSGIEISCLSKQDVIYDDFICRDGEDV